MGRYLYEPAYLQKIFSISKQPAEFVFVLVATSRIVQIFPCTGALVGLTLGQFFSSGLIGY